MFLDTLKIVTKLTLHWTIRKIIKNNASNWITTKLTIDSLPNIDPCADQLNLVTHGICHRIGYWDDGELEDLYNTLRKEYLKQGKSVEEMMGKMVLITDAKYCDKYTMKKGNK